MNNLFLKIFLYLSPFMPLLLSAAEIHNGWIKVGSSLTCIDANRSALSEFALGVSHAPYEGEAQYEFPQLLGVFKDVAGGKSVDGQAGWVLEKNVERKPEASLWDWTFKYFNLDCKIIWEKKHASSYCASLNGETVILFEARKDSLFSDDRYYSIDGVGYLPRVYDANGHLLMEPVDKEFFISEGFLSDSGRYGAVKSYSSVTGDRVVVFFDLITQKKITVKGDDMFSIDDNGRYEIYKADVRHDELLQSVQLVNKQVLSEGYVK